MVRQDYLIASDYGNTATAVAVPSGEGPAPAFSDGSSTAPSPVFAADAQRLLTGAGAVDDAEFRLDAYEPTPERRITDGQTRLNECLFSASELIGPVLAPLLAEAIGQHGGTTPAAELCDERSADSGGLSPGSFGADPHLAGAGREGCSGV